MKTPRTQHRKHSSRPGCTALLCPALLSAAIGAAPAAAQEGELMLEEIIITAERRQASLQDTAISVSAFSGEDLARAGIETSEHLAGITPGLQIQRDVIGKVVIRGVGAENFTVAGDPGVAISADGVYLARSSVSIFDLFDLERVEVLRGPQGTLYGRNATGGAINFIANKPTDELQVAVSGDVGDFNKRRLEAALSGPLVEGRLLGRIAGLIHDRDGYTENIFPGVGRGLDELDNKDLRAGRLLLTWLPSDDLSIEFKADVYRDDSNPVPYKYTDDPLIFQGGIPFANPLAARERVVSQGYEFEVPGLDIRIDEAGRWDQDGVQATLNWQLPNGANFKSITASREADFEWLNDGDGLQAYLVNYFQVDTSEQFSQELQLSSSGAGPINWIVGLYYLTEDSDSFIGIPLPLGADLPLAVLINGESETEAVAVFGEIKYELTERLLLNLGLRFSQEEKQVFYVDDRSSLGGSAVTVDDDNDWDAATPKIGLEYFPREGLMFYGSVTQGFKSGGYNLLAVQPSYDEEEVTSFEVGMKGRFFDERMQLNTSLFYYDYSDMQVGKVQELSATIQNAAESTIYGAEVEMLALLSQQLQLSAGISLLQTEYDDFETQDPAPPGDIVNLEGNELPRAPAFTAALAATYTRPLAGGGTLELWGNWQYTGEQFFTPFNRPSVSQDAYDVINAKITYRSPSQRWALTLYGDNLGDEEYFTNALESGVPLPGIDPVVPQFFLGAPRMWGLRINYQI